MPRMDRSYRRAIDSKRRCTTRYADGSQDQGSEIGSERGSEGFPAIAAKAPFPSLAFGEVDAAEHSFTIIISRQTASRFHINYCFSRNATDLVSMFRISKGSTPRAYCKRSGASCMAVGNTQPGNIALNTPLCASHPRDLPSQPFPSIAGEAKQDVPVACFALFHLLRHRKSHLVAQWQRHCYEEG